jgi:hypothetical protein
LEIARQLAVKEFMSRRDDDTSDGQDDAASLGSSIQSMHVSHRAADIICNPKYTGIFSHKIERSYVTQINLGSICAGLEEAMRHPSITLQSLVKTMRRMLKVLIASVMNYVSFMNMVYSILFFLCHRRPCLDAKST